MKYISYAQKLLIFLSITLPLPMFAPEDTAKPDLQENLWKYADILAKTGGKAARGTVQFAHYAPLVAKAATWDLYNLVITFRELIDRIKNQVLPGYQDWYAAIGKETAPDAKTALSAQLLIELSPFLSQSIDLGKVVNDGYIYIFSPELYETLDEFFSKSARFINALNNAAIITKNCTEKKLSAPQKAAVQNIQKAASKPVHKWIKSKVTTKAWSAVDQVKQWTPESIKNATEVAQNIKVLNKTIKQELLKELDTWEKLYTTKKLSPAADAYYAVYILEKLLGPLKRALVLTTNTSQEISKVVKKEKQKKLFNMLHTYFDMLRTYVETGIDQLATNALICIPESETITPEDKKIFASLGIPSAKFKIQETPSTLHFNDLFGTLERNMTNARQLTQLNPETPIAYDSFISQIFTISKDLAKYSEDIQNQYDARLNKLIDTAFKDAAEYSARSVDAGVKYIQSINIDSVMPLIKDIKNQPFMFTQKIDTEIWQPFEIAIDLAKQAVEDGQMLKIEKDMRLFPQQHLDEKSLIAATQEKMKAFQEVTKKLVYRILNVANKSNDKAVIAYLAEIAPYVLIHYSEFLALVGQYNQGLAQELALTKTPEKFIDMIKTGIEKSFKRLGL